MHGTLFDIFAFAATVATFAWASACAAQAIYVGFFKKYPKD
jgi:hypothetical protein